MTGFGREAGRTPSTLIAAFSLGGRSALASGKGARSGLAVPVQWGVGVLLVLTCVLVLAQVYWTGESGARAVWG